MSSPKDWIWSAVCHLMGLILQKRGEVTPLQSAVDWLGHIEQFGKWLVGYKHGQSVITPKRSVTYARAQLNILIQKNIKVVCIDDPNKPKHGDHMYVNIDDSIRHMTKGLGIYVLAQRLNMECCLSSDRTDFTKKEKGHATMGLKFTGFSAIDPKCPGV